VAPAPPACSKGGSRRRLFPLRLFPASTSERTLIDGDLRRVDRVRQVRTLVQRQGLAAIDEFHFAGGEIQPAIVRALFAPVNDPITLAARCAGVARKNIISTELEFFIHGIDL
jgi:hypothetical protein